MARKPFASWGWVWTCAALATVHCGGDDSGRSPSTVSDGSGGTAGGDVTSSTGSGGSDAGGSGGSGAAAAAGGSGGAGGSTSGGAGGSGGTGAGMGGEAGQPAVDAPPPGEAGYLDVDAYFFRGGPELDGLTAASTRLFYAFLEADDAVSERPLFVFTGGIPDLTGGSLIPGPASSGLFAVFGVSRTTLDGAALAMELEENPNSWTSMGSLLFIDSRQSGFSYSTLEDPTNDGARGAEYASNNFNNFVDAADLVRGLLQFLRAHPELTDNPVVLVGQGYASIRTSLMLSYLLYPERLYEDAAWNYTDEALADELLDHYANVFPDEPSIDAEVAATQFGWQIHLQPKIGGDQQGITADLWCQPGTPEYEAAETLDETCPPPSRDSLNLGKSAGWSLMLRQASQQALLDPNTFASILFADPTAVVGLPAAERNGAYRVGTMLAVEDVFPRAPAVWTDDLGALETHDRYYLGNVEQLISGNSNFTEGNDLGCLSFIENVQHVAAFVTNAALDGHIRTEALKATLEDCSTYVDAFILESVDSDTAAQGGVARPGWLTLNYNDTAEIGAASRTVRWPAYGEAGHLVSVSAPAELKQDVREFLEQSGLELAP